MIGIRVVHRSSSGERGQQVAESAPLLDGGLDEHVRRFLFFGHGRYADVNDSEHDFVVRVVEDARRPIERLRLVAQVVAPELTRFLDHEAHRVRAEERIHDDALVAATLVGCLCLVVQVQEVVHGVATLSAICCYVRRSTPYALIQIFVVRVGEASRERFRRLLPSLCDDVFFHRRFLEGFNAKWGLLTGGG